MTKFQNQRDKFIKTQKIQLNFRNPRPVYHPFLNFWSYKTTLTSFLSSAPKTSQRPRTRRPRPKHKTTPSPAASESKLGKYVVPGTCGTLWNVILAWQFNLPPNSSWDPSV